MVQSFLRLFTWVLVVVLLQVSPSAGQQNANPATTEDDFVLKNFKFQSGETLPQLRLHYTTLGKPVRDAQGRVINAVLILHGTGGSGHQFLQPIFAGELFGAGQLLDATRYYIILPDGIGHGKSSKPSDGLHGRADAAGLSASADRGAQPRVAQDGDGRDSQRSGMEGRRIFRGTATSAAYRAGSAAHRGKRAALHAKDSGHARRR